jgi:hypothetical protein
MTDDLDEAVDARLVLHRPETLPPFDMITARRRRRDRRTAATAAAAVAAAALGVALLPGGFGFGGTDSARLTTGPAEVHRYRVGPSDEAHAVATRACLELPGTSDLAEILSLPPSFEVTVTGTVEVAAFHECFGDLPSVDLREIPAARKDGLLSVTGILRATGGPPGVSQPGQPGQVVLEGDRGRFTAEANGAGKFSLRVPPGDYTATGTSPLFNDGRGVCRADGPVKVTTTDVLGVIVACSRK